MYTKYIIFKYKPEAVCYVALVNNGRLKWTEAFVYVF